MKKWMLIGCMIIGLFVFTGSAEARYDYEIAYGYSGKDSAFRNAVAMDDWLERGRAAVTESPLFPDGVRLTAEGGEGTDETGLASAIYYFTIPRGVQYLTIHIQYSDTSYDDQIAGRLWIKSSDTAMQGEPGVGEEAPLYGDTFVLRSERSSESITVPTSRHVEGGTVELHVVAQGTDCIDVRDIRVEYLSTRPQITVVHRTHTDYWDRWPHYRYAYHYFYWGPLFWPSTSVVYECWDVPIGFYWITWRPWFFVNIICVHHQRPWWGPRRYTVVYHVDKKQPLFTRRTLIRTRLKEHQVQVTRILHANPVIRQTDRTRLPQAQEVRKETQAPRRLETKVNPNPVQRHVKEQPTRVDKGREEPRVDIQNKTVKKPQTTNNLASHSAHPTDTEQQPRAAKQQPQANSVTQEKTVQTPVQKQLNKPGKEVSKVTPTPAGGRDTSHVARETKRQETPQRGTRTTTVNDTQVVKKPDTRQTRPADTTPQRIQKEHSQPRTVERQTRSRSEVRDTGRESARVEVSRDNQARPQGGQRGRR